MLLLIGSILPSLEAQVYVSDATGTYFSGTPVGLYDGSLEWGDFDADGDLDILATGRAGTVDFRTIMYEYNSGTNTFSNFAGADNILDLYLSDAEFGDYDNDGDLDIAICGKDLAANRHTKIYYFDEVQGIYREDSTASPCLAGVENGDLAWGDYNNDGLLDLAVMGRNATGLQTQIYRNEGFGVFVPAQSIAPGVEFGEIIWADINNDAYLDLLYTGANASGSAVTRLFVNLQDGTFDFQPSGLQNAKLGSIDVSDYDADGDLDVLVTGATNIAGTTLISRVYTNLGGGAFINLNAGLTPIKNGTAEWGDFNNDGRPDIIQSGADGNGGGDRITEIYFNQSGSSFQLQGPTSNALSQLNGNASAAWGDVDGDQKIDLLLSGTVGTNSHTFKLFQNTEPTTDVLTPPTPNTLNATIAGDQATLTWNTPNGSYGSALKPGLTFNLFIGTSSGDDDVVPGMANLSTGFRRIVTLGSLKEESWTIKGLSPGNYTWRVQSIDPGFEASVFSSQGSFSIVTPVPLSHFEDVTGPRFGGISPAGMGEAATAWVDIDGDGDQDLMMSGLVSDLEPNSTDFRTRIFRNNGGDFQEIPGSLGLPDLYQASIEWGDVNLDNLPDVILSGTGTSGRVTEVYINQGNGFTALNAGLEAVTNGSLDLGDYDQDGDLDLLMTGSGTGTVTKVYENRYIPTQTLSFQEDVVASQDLTDVFGGDAKWGDYDQDGFPDVLLTGNDGAGSLVGELFRNDGAGGFNIYSPANVPSVWRSSVAWADVNNDGMLDMVIAGDLSSNSTTPNPAVFFKKQENNAGITFPQSGSLPGRAGGSVDLGDYNDDGYVDLLLTGQGIDTVHYSEVFLNNTSESNPAFLLEPLASDVLRGVNMGSAAAWGDYDSDGKLDIFLTGILRGGGKISRLYENIESTNNTVPNVPQNLVVEPAGFDVRVTWDAPSAPGNQEDGYTYAVYVRKLGAPADSLVASPEAELATGDRYLTEEGKAGSATELLVKNLVPGLYEWTVQAVAQDLEGSAFATRDTFTYENPSFEDQTANFFPIGNPPIGLFNARMAFGDFRNNGSLDLIAIGESNTNPYETVLYQYDPNTDKFSISPFTSSFIDVREGSVDWGDFNNDGDADVLITGLSSAGRVARIYENNGASFQSGGFYNLPNGGVSDGCAVFGDFNNDGFVDVFMTGTDINGLPSSRFYRNNGNETYTNLGNLGVDDLTTSWADWGDFNNDGYLDLAVIGYNGSNARTRLYVNQKNETFQLLTGTSFTNVRNGTIEFGDFNSDGFLDLGYTGTNASENQRITQIWKNNGDLTFSAMGNIQDEVGYGSLDWGDYDDDGYQDLIITGQNGPNSSDRVVRLYRYDAGLDALIYEIIGSSVFTGVNNGSDAAWADVDQDGKLDVMIAGEKDNTSNGGSFFFYKNINNIYPNVTPGPPSKLAEVIQGYEVLLGWDAPSNVEDSILAGISYNVYVGTSPGGIDRRSPNSRLSTGERKLVTRGAVSDTTSFRLLNLPPGKYYWSVQAIDADFEPSIFAVEDSFEYLPPTFADVTNQAFGGFPDGISEGSMEWGDFDEDGFLDLIAVGNSSAGAVALFYQNNGDGTFTSISPTFPPLLHTDLSLQDYDRDGKLDFLLQGETFGGQILTGLYQNSGSDVFTLVSSGIDSLTMGASAWKDLNQDGLPDLAIMGSDGSSPQLKVYVQTATGVFAEISGPFVGLEKGDLKWIDYNKDGFWDLLATGDNDQGNSEIYLYEYDGNLGFTEINNTFIPASLGSLDIGDFDNDGWSDFLLSGVDNSGVRAVRVYQNQSGSGTFSLFDAFLDTAGIERGEARWADYDDNGRLDIVVVGRSSTGRTAQVIRNQFQGGQTVFEIREIAALPIQPSEDATLAWGDFNNDGKVDLAVSGEQISSPPIRGIRLYQNIDSTVNVPAPIPTSLDYVQVSDTIILTWNVPAGAEGLTSNLYVQTPAGTVDVVSPLADPTSGKGFVAAPGNVGQRRIYKLYNIEDGTYNWGVQTVDHDYEHSPWSNQGQFDFTAPDLVENNLNYLDLQGNIPTGFAHGDLAWADYDGDTDLDLLVSGETGDGTASTVLLENTDGVFRADQTATALFPNLRYSAVAWADYNQDGAPDVLIAGETGASGGPGNGEFTTSLFLNDGNGSFSLDPKGAKFPDLTLAAIAWADFDQDGDQDVVMSGRTAFGAETILYTNQDSVFLPYPYIDLIPVEAGALAWGDFDADGDLDLAVSGDRDNGDKSSRIYRNNGIRGGFTRMESSDAPLTPVGKASLAWGDLEQDGLLELLLTGEKAGTPPTPITEVYRYNVGADRFELVPGFTLPPVMEGEGAWGDYNDDGFQDVVLTGTNGGGGELTRLYLNNQSGVLQETAFSSDALLDAYAGSQVAWGDIERDGKLDLALIGQTSEGPIERTLTLFQNRNEAANQLPTAPTNLNAITNADSVVLSWDAPAVSDGFTYNLVIGTSENQGDIKSPLAELPLSANDGLRKIVGRGNAASQLSWRATSLPAGTYYWTVQSIDPDFEGSPFAQVDSFTFVPPHFTDITSIGFAPGEAALLQGGSMAWGDIDGDNDLDLFVSGETNGGAIEGIFYENLNAKDLLINSTIQGDASGTRNGDADWHDYDADGDLDLLLVGESASGATANIYEFDGTALIAQNPGFTPLLSGKARWIDVDNDGDADVFLTGRDASGQGVAELHLNGGKGSFSLAAATFVPITNGDIVWTDVDGNSFADLVAVGEDGNNQAVSLLYLNKGNALFTVKTNAFETAPGLVELKLDAGDENNDGYPDLAMVGENDGGQPATLVYVNRGDSTAVFDLLDLTDTPLEQLKNGDAKWGDYNEDGYLDLIIGGENAAGDRKTLVYQSENQGDAFQLDSLAIEYMEPVVEASIAWMDLNRDRKLDVAVLGRHGSGPVGPALQLYRNDEPSRNVIPSPPENLQEEVVGDVLILSWDLPAGVDSTRSLGYAYNLYIGTAAETDDIRPAVSELEAGLLNGNYRLVQPAEGLYKTQWFVEGLEEGLTYHWGVQAIDQDFEGSAFRSKTLEFTPPAFSDVTDILFPDALPEGNTEGEIAIADVDLDGDLDVVASGETGPNTPSTVLYTYENGVYQLDATVSEALSDVSLSALAWGDYNQDGYPDLALSGRLQSGDFITELYQGSPEGLMLDADNSERLPGLIRGDLAFADYDNDGDQDLIICGQPETGASLTQLYENQGEDGFALAETSSEVFPGLSGGELAWGDYDQDGDLDLAMTGTSDQGAGITHIYRNDRNGQFSLKKSLAQLKNSSLAWGDVFNLGFLGLAVTGTNDDNDQAFSQYYRYDPADTTEAFIADTSIQLLGVSNGHISMADYNDDGFLDILLAGQSENGRATKIYTRNDEGRMVEDLNTSADLTNIDLGTAAWGDYDQDQKLDLFLSGRTSTQPSIASFAVFQNIDSASNTTYGPPTQLKEQIFGPTITFRWQPPQGLSTIEEGGLTFNFYLGQANNRAEIVSSLSDTEAGNSNGYRRIVHMGNAGHSKSWKVSGIPDGDYVWSVQVVDADREGSAFADEIAFSFTNPVPVIIDSSFADQWRKGEGAVGSSIRVSPDSVIQDVIVHHRGIGDKEFQTTSLTKGADDRFTFEIGEGIADEIGAEYFFEVVGDFGFFAYTDTHYTYTYYPNGLEVSDIRFGREVNDYNIVSVPLNLDNSSLENVLIDDFGNYNVFQWRFMQYQSGSVVEVGSGLDKVATGEGYWLITKEQRSFNTGAGEAVRVHAMDPYVIPLQAGWNQIGNPYPYKIIWNDVLDSNTVASAKLGPMTLYTSTGYLPDQDGIDAFSGAFVFSDSALNLRIPVTKNDAILRRPKMNLIHHGPLDSEKWQLPLVLQSGDIWYPVGGFGMAPDAAESKDRYDVISLPRLDRYLDIYTEHPEFSHKRFSRDIVPSQDSYIWEFTVSSTLGEELVELSWKNEAFDVGGKQLILFDVERQLAIDLLKQTSYESYSNQEARRFRLYYGDEAFIQENLNPDLVFLGLAYPNPSAGKVHIPVSFPEASEEYQTELVIFSGDGRMIDQVTSQAVPGGFHTFTWDRTNDAGKRQPAGLYLYQLRVRHGEEIWQETKRLILK